MAKRISPYWKLTDNEAKTLFSHLVSTQATLPKVLHPLISSLDEYFNPPQPVLVPQITAVDEETNE